jgi:hypothetical protein
MKKPRGIVIRSTLPKGKKPAFSDQIMLDQRTGGSALSRSYFPVVPGWQAAHGRM